MTRVCKILDLLFRYFRFLQGKYSKSIETQYRSYFLSLCIQILELDVSCKGFAVSRMWHTILFVAADSKITKYSAFNCLFRMQSVVATENISLFALLIEMNVIPLSYIYEYRFFS